MDLSTMLMELGQGMLKSFEIFALTLVFSLPLGLFVALGRMSKYKVIQWIMRVYISIMRGTPLMLQLLVVYFGPFYIFGIAISPAYREVAVILGFSLNYAAYFAEIYRSGIAQTFLKIILPQVVKSILPPVTNEIIVLIKDTSLAFAISVSEMFTVAKAIAAAEKTMGALLAAGVFYYIFNFIVAMLMEKVEQKLNYYR